jgi:hypothetical protein
VGRATFYSHFETKDFLLKELCEELFCHLFDSMGKGKEEHRHIFECTPPDSVFLHLVLHLQKNDNNILGLLSSQNNDLFLKYFKSGLGALVERNLLLFESEKSSKLPESFRINHISSTFVETVKWWIEGGMKESPETITDYFFAAVR